MCSTWGYTSGRCPKQGFIGHMSYTFLRVDLMLRLFSKEFVTVLIFLLVILASAGDLISDLTHGVKTAHVIQEGIVLVVAVAALAWIIKNIRMQSSEIETLNQQLEDARNLPLPGNARLIDARKTLADIMAIQFADWGLSKSEKEVGLLLLKGLSLKEIAILRGTAEKTIRQQASSIYQKANVTGRHSFSAWFIEDFL